MERRHPELISASLDEPHGLFDGVGELVESGGFEGFGEGVGEALPDVVDRRGGFAFSCFGFFEELGVDGFDDVGEGDFGRFVAKEVAAAFSTLGNDEICLF